MNSTRANLILLSDSIERHRSELHRLCGLLDEQLDAIVPRPSYSPEATIEWVARRESSVLPKLEKRIDRSLSLRRALDKLTPDDVATLGVRSFFEKPEAPHPVKVVPCSGLLRAFRLRVSKFIAPPS